jgi:hypothetical protein
MYGDPSSTASCVLSPEAQLEACETSESTTAARSAVVVGGWPASTSGSVAVCHDRDQHALGDGHVELRHSAGLNRTRLTEPE